MHFKKSLKGYYSVYKLLQTSVSGRSYAGGTPHLSKFVCCCKLTVCGSTKVRKSQGETVNNKLMDGYIKNTKVKSRVIKRLGTATAQYGCGR